MTEADKAVVEAERSSALANRRGNSEGHEQAEADAWEAVALLEAEGRTAAADVWRDKATEHHEMFIELRGPQGPHGNPRIRLLAETSLNTCDSGTPAEPEMADGEENLWTGELIFEVALPDGRMFLTRSWFEASGHGESDDDGNEGGKVEIRVHGYRTTPNALTQCAMLMGWYDQDRKWVEITKDGIKDAIAQFAWFVSK